MLWALPLLAQAQSSPFMTGATALQSNILAWLTPIAIILVMVLGAMAMANRIRSGLSERLRAEYHERLQQRLVSSHGPAAGESLSERLGSAASPAKWSPSVPSRSIEEIRRQAREAWLLLRAKEAASGSDRSRGAAPVIPREAAAERETQQAELPGKDDLAL